MQKTAGHKIVIIGCGNVAWHLAKQFSALKKHDLFIYNHKANVLLNDFKTKLKCNTQNNLNNIIADADYYFICVADKFISVAAKKIKIANKNAVVIHTSGSLKLNELGKQLNTAVLYPLQTFSRKDNVSWKEVPIIIEANNAASKNKVMSIARLLSNNVSVLTYKERLKLHLTAVLVNNFTNSLFIAANDLVKRQDMLLPLIQQTVLKIEKLDPLAAQTGPAKRNDKTVMKKHLKLLENDPDLKKIYKQMSALILKQQTKKHA